MIFRDRDVRMYGNGTPYISVSEDHPNPNPSNCFDSGFRICLPQLHHD
jgi:hypothetical protein